MPPTRSKPVEPMSVAAPLVGSIESRSAMPSSP
jgi:hypothetical protein